MSLNFLIDLSFKVLDNLFVLGISDYLFENQDAKKVKSVSEMIRLVQIRRSNGKLRLLHLENNSPFASQFKKAEIVQYCKIDRIKSTEQSEITFHQF